VLVAVWYAGQDGTLEFNLDHHTGVPPAQSDYVRCINTIVLLRMST